MKMQNMRRPRRGRDRGRNDPDARGLAGEAQNRPWSTLLASRLPPKVKRRRLSTGRGWGRGSAL